jgi:hypothetical protein
MWYLVDIGGHGAQVPHGVDDRDCFCEIIFKIFCQKFQKKIVFVWSNDKSVHGLKWQRQLNLAVAPRPSQRLLLNFGRRHAKTRKNFLC